MKSNPNVTFQQIEAFLKAAEYRSLSKAARAMFTSQPALTMMLRRFEDSVGAQLFNRSNQGIVPTAEGRFLFSQLEPLYVEMEKAFATARILNMAPKQLLRIVMSDAYEFTEDYAPIREIANRYHRDYPLVEMCDSICNLVELRQALKSGPIDLVVAPAYAVSDVQNISLRHVARCEMYLVMSSAHPLASGGGLDVKALCNEIFYTLPYTEQSSDKDIVYEQCNKIGFRPKDVLFLPNYTTIYHTVRQGKGMTIGGRFIYYENDTGCRSIPLELGDATPHIAVAWRTGSLTPEARDLVEMLPDLSR
jgi:DNA-binding transcriptional LysR family regulator